MAYSKISKLDRNMYHEAAQEGITLSQLFERLDPSPEGNSLDAFDRKLKDLGIAVKSVPGKSIIASQVEAFYQTDDSRVMFPEYLARVAREAIMAESILPYLIATSTPIEGITYKPITVINQPSQQSKRRVTENGKLPIFKLAYSEGTVNLYKYGAAMEASYEIIRRMRIDLLAIHVRRIAAQAALDKATEALYVVRYGDSNADPSVAGSTTNPATVKKTSDFDAARTTGTLSLKGWLGWLLNFYPYQCNTVVANVAGLLQVLTLTYPSVDIAQLLAILVGGNPVTARVQVPQGLWQNVTLLYSPDVETINAHPILYGLDKRYAIEELSEIGSDISEADKFIMNQTQVLTISETNGYSKILPLASAILEID